MLRVRITMSMYDWNTELKLNIGIWVIQVIMVYYGLLKFE